MDFFVIKRDRFNDNDYAFGEEVDFLTGEYEKCDKCGSPISMRRWLPPHKVRLSKPKYGDVVYGTFSTFLVSEHFRNEYQQSNLVGIKSFEPVEVVKVQRKKSSSPEPPQYYHVDIKVSNIRIDENASQFVRGGVIECSECRTGGNLKSFSGIFLDESTWDGNDIFFPIGLSGTIMATKRFYEFVASANITNVELIPAKSYVASWVLGKRTL